MRMSCNGCRVLRKGCSEGCVIRPCLQWIPNAEAQANATVFLAKFYGRAGLINLIAAGPDHQRQALFRSLLYEACGRIVNPVYGSVGLLWSGNWQLCQAAVESVLKGRPIAASPVAAATSVPLLKSCDIRHVAKIRDITGELHHVSDKSKSKFKRAGTSGHMRPSFILPDDQGEGFVSGPLRCEPSHESGNRESDSHVSVETVVDSHVSQAEPSGKDVENGDMGLDLTLGLVSVTRSSESNERTMTAKEDGSDAEESRSETSPFELGLTIPVAV